MTETVSVGLMLVLETVYKHPGKSFTELELLVPKMCERILGSQLARLVRRDWIVYDSGKYTATSTGKKVIDNV